MKFVWRCWSAWLLAKGFREYRRFTKLGRQTGDVTAFGAVGNGFADDTQAIKRAIAYRLAASVSFPSGRYVVSHPIAVSDGRPIKLVGGQTR